MPVNTFGSAGFDGGFFSVMLRSVSGAGPAGTNMTPLPGPLSVTPPPSIVVAEGSASAVFRVANGVAKRVSVTPGAKIGDLVELSGVAPGDTLVLRPAASLRDGVAVKTGGK